MKCAMCQSRAEVWVSWPITTEGEYRGDHQRHAACDACGHLVWDQISTKFSGTEACMCFTIEPIEAFA